MNDLINVDVNERVSILRINRPPVNALSPELADALTVALQDIAANRDIEGVVIAGHGQTFAAGADIGLLEEAAWQLGPWDPRMVPLFAALEAMSQPVVMAIHGAALGGGLELAMAGHYRVALEGARFGQPEVNLGLIPGFEGTQRLPRLCGLPLALDLCVSGRSITATDARNAGIIDEVVDGDLMAGAVELARSAARRGGPHPVTSRRTDRLPARSERQPLRTAARARAKATRPGETAPHLAIEALDAACFLPFNEGRQLEETLFLKALSSDQARAMIHLFFAERAFDKFGRDPQHAEWQRQGTEQLKARAERASQRGDALADALANEGARLVGLGLFARTSDVDVVAVRDCGFARWRGGPMFAADQAGLDRVLARIRHLHDGSGNDWRPAPLLEELGAAGKTFREWDRTRG